ncbi:Serine/threonine-protein kinase [Podospora australis]|uniref:non-specific serine/threonine protein kinase n=1 Tax=Podospora australis TaxID=1536484 RepID=A0AAN6WIG1_9PEZI|nr:Serine/threonine-protein kinase [Podospora australis]
MDETTRLSKALSPKPKPTQDWPEIALEEGVLIEEECFPWYQPEKWYSVEIGDVIKDRYQILVKLGYGSVSTAWLCRDLQTTNYVGLKIYETGHRQSLNETKVPDHLDATANPKHPGYNLLRFRLDSFELPGKVGPHVCLVHKPLSVSIEFLREMFEGKLPLNPGRPALIGMILALDYLHKVAGIVHTDLQEANILLSVGKDHCVFDEAVDEEWSDPSPRKTTNGRVVHVTTSIELPDDGAQPVITDFGEAKFGSNLYYEEVMPDLTAWNKKIDIWALGLMIWDMFEGKHLFNQRLPSREESAAAHLARMISLLGPPPAELIETGPRSSLFSNNDGQ